MRALVTGSAGFIGSHLVELLESQGWDVVGIDKRTGPTISQSVFPLDPDAIFHLASPVGPLGVLGAAGSIAKEIVVNSWIVAGAALHAGCPLIYVSTSEVYGSGTQSSETDPCHFGAETSARKEYAVAKLAAETMLRNTAGLDVRIVRPFNVAGPGQLPDGGFVLPRFVQQALADEALTVYRPGSQRRAFAHVTDVVEGIYLSWSAGEQGEVYNLGNPDNACTVRELAEEVIAAVGSGYIELVDPVRLHGPAFREAPDKLPNGTKARHELGWLPRKTRAVVIADTLDYWRSRLTVAA